MPKSGDGRVEMIRTLRVARRSAMKARTQADQELVSLLGIGTENAAILLIVAGDNPQRLRSEASFASLCEGSLPS